MLIQFTLSKRYLDRLVNRSMDPILFLFLPTILTTFYLNQVDCVKYKDQLFDQENIGQDLFEENLYENRVNNNDQLMANTSSTPSHSNSTSKSAIYDQFPQTRTSSSNFFYMYLADQQFIDILTNYPCEPRPKLVYVRSRYPMVGKTVAPICTVLHVCSDDTGCCSNEAYTCGPKTQVEVIKYFRVKTLETNKSSIVGLNFINHTSCECKRFNSQFNHRSMFTLEDGDVFDQILAKDLLYNEQSNQVELQVGLERELPIDEAEDEKNHNNNKESPSEADPLSRDHFLKFGPLEETPPETSDAINNEELFVQFSSHTKLTSTRPEVPSSTK